MPTARPARHLSALWVLGLAFAAMGVALSGSLPGWAGHRGMTQLADSHFVPDEAVLPAPPHGLAAVNAHQPSAEDHAQVPGTSRELPAMRWNGRADRLWPLPDGRGFVVSPWGATWWQHGAQRQRTELDLPGLDPALGALRLSGDRLLIPRPQGGAWLLELGGEQPVLHTLSAQEAATSVQPASGPLPAPEAARRSLFQ